MAAVSLLLTFAVCVFPVAVNAWSCPNIGLGGVYSSSHRRNQNTHHFATISRDHLTAEPLRCRLNSSAAKPLRGASGENEENEKAFADDERDDDPDGTPLQLKSLEGQERATLFGLEPKEDLDPMDNGLAFTGPLILLFSVYITISLFMGETPDVDAILRN